MSNEKGRKLVCYMDWRSLLFLNHTLKQDWATNKMDKTWSEKGRAKIKNTFLSRLLETASLKPVEMIGDYKFIFYEQDLLNIIILLEGGFITLEEMNSLKSVFGKITEMLWNDEIRGMKNG